MLPFRPFHPSVLAIAQELERRAIANPEISPLEAIQGLLNERPPLDIQGYTTMAHQINDLMGIANPPDDQIRLGLMLFLPGRRGSLFTAQHLPLRDALFFKQPMCMTMTPALAASLDAKWDEVLKVIENMPLPPAPLVNGSGVPIEAKHPAASGPVPENIQKFMRKDGE